MKSKILNNEDCLSLEVALKRTLSKYALPQKTADCVLQEAKSIGYSMAMSSKKITAKKTVVSYAPRKIKWETKITPIEFARIVNSYIDGISTSKDVIDWINEKMNK